MGGSRLARRLRELPVGSRQITLVETAKGWQAAMKVEGGMRVDIRADPVDALLVATGAVSVLDMNKKDRERMADLLGLDDDDTALLG